MKLDALPLTRRGATDAVMVALFVLMLLAIAGFVGIAVAVKTGYLKSVDEKMIDALREPQDSSDPLGPKWLEEMGRDLTALGGFAALPLVTAAVVGYLLLCRQWRAIVWIVTTSLGGLLVTAILKESFDRPRPIIVPNLSYVSSPSFPSGHSMLSAIVYLALGIQLAHHAERRLLKGYFFFVAGLATLLVGASRVYMGVHYPTDVMAGWSAGLAWTILCRFAAHFLAKRFNAKVP